MRARSLALPFLLAGLVAAQGSLTAITNSQRAHIDAKLSPSGTHVAFRVGRSDLGVVTFAGAGETLIFTSATANLGSYVWDVNGNSLYVADGGTLRSVPRGGGSTIAIGTVSGTNVMLWATDGTWVYGSRQNGQQAAAFRQRVNGQGMPADLVTVTGTIDEIALSPNRGYLLIANGSGVPFTAPTMVRYQIANQTITTLGNPVFPLTSIAWLDEGANFVAASRTANVASTQVVAFDAGTNPTPFTETPQFHRRTVYAGGNWILCETVSPTGNGITIALMPFSGGGVVHVDTGRPLLVNGGQQYGGLSTDAAGTKIAVCGSTGSGDPFPQIYAATIDRDIQVSPRLQTGQVFTIGMPLAASDVGAVAVAFGLTQGTPVQVPPLTGEFNLDITPGSMTTVLSGLATGGLLQGAWTIPANQSLIGLQLWFQGLRFNAQFQGAFTRFGQYQVF
ncbi:MAG: hypothetical protein IPK26_04375 [Planctomycetes bacterium]|nr:hypothetical protein [Planctomycetota bacterium]